MLLCWNPSLTSVSLSFHFRTLQLIIKHLHPSLNPIIKWKTPKLFLRISAPSANCLPSSVMISILKNEKCLWALIYLKQNKVWADLSWQQRKPHRKYSGQYLHADHTIILDRKIVLMHFTHMNPVVAVSMHIFGLNCFHMNPVLSGLIAGLSILEACRSNFTQVSNPLLTL